MRSIASTWLLLGVIFLVYASCGMALFQENDPFHFGSIAMSMWTFFEMSTLEVRIFFHVTHYTVELVDHSLSEYLWMCGLCSL